MARAAGQSTCALQRKSRCPYAIQRTGWRSSARAGQKSCLARMGDDRRYISPGVQAMKRTGEPSEPVMGNGRQATPYRCPDLRS